MVRAKLVIQRGGKLGKEFGLSGEEALIGRWDADGGIFPDVDLDQDDPEAKVSRRHARIQYLNNQFTIEDLGSTNGTYVKLAAPQVLTNQDEFRIAEQRIRFESFAPVDKLAATDVITESEGGAVVLPPAAAVAAAPVAVPAWHAMCCSPFEPGVRAPATAARQGGPV